MDPKLVATSGSAWVIEPGYSVAQFQSKLLFFKFNGAFSQVTGTLLRAEQLNRSSIEAVVNVASIDTSSKRLAARLCSPRFLDASGHPQISFRSTSVERGTDRDTLVVKGLLTIKGVTREITLDVTEMDHSQSPQGEYVAYYTAVTRINRHHFGITYGRGMISAQVLLRVHIQAMKKN